MLTILVWMLTCAEAAPHRGHKQRPRYTCSAPSNSSYFLRSGCSEGAMVTVVRGRLVLQLQGLARYDPRAEFVKESCVSSSSNPSNPYLLDLPLVRYRHRETGRYLCFTRKGKARTLGKRGVEAKGLRCMFHEQLLEGQGEHLALATFHTIKSASPMGWFLGFNLAKRSTFALKGGRGRGAMARVGWREVGRSCGFRFHSEEVKEVREEEEKLLNSILEFIEDNEVEETGDRKSVV